MGEHTLLVYTLDDNKGKLESLAAIKKRMWKNKRKRAAYLINYQNPFKQDLQNIYEMTTQETWRVAKLPNLNGLYGGKACNRTDGKELTMYAAEWEDEKKFYGTYEEFRKNGFCDLQLCSLDRYEPKPGQPETNGSEPIVPGCKKEECQKDGGCMSMWTAWSEWGKCNKDFGNRNRTRSCVCACDLTVEKKDCRPAQRMLGSENVTDEDKKDCKRNQQFNMAKFP